MKMAKDILTHFTEDFKKGFEQGYNKALDDHHILHGESAKKFMEQFEANNRGEISSKQKAFLDECTKLLKNTKLTK